MEKEHLIYISILPILLILTSLVVSLTNISINTLTTFDVFSIFELIFSIYGLISIGLIIVTLTFLIIILSKPLEQSELMFLIGFYIIGIVIGGLFSYEFIFGGLFSVLGLIIGIKLNKKKEGFATGKNISSKIVLFFVIGFFLTVLFVTYTNKEMLEENFVNDLLYSTIGDEDYFSKNLEEPVIDLVISSQKETLLLVKKIPGFDELETKTDLDTIRFVNGFSEMNSQINSQNYRETLLEEMSKQDDALTLNALKETKIATNLSGNAYLLYALEIAALFLLIGNLIISNLVGLLFFVYDKTLPKTNY